jgi:exonuclease SbcD
MKTNRKAVALGLTDTHAHDNNLALQESIWKQAISICEEKDIKKIYHFGDWVTARKAQSLEVLEHLSWIKDTIFDNDLSLIGISGNHDKTNQESIFAYPNLLKDEGFHVVEYGYQDNISDNISVWFLPYFPEKGTYKDRVEAMKKQLDPNKTNVLITHVGINGGLAHENATVNKEVPADLFIGFDIVLVGHYHNRNKIDFNEVDIHYVGSPFAANFGEDNEKGFTIIYDDGSIEFINANFPRYETIEIEVEAIDGKWLSQTKKHIKESGSNVRVIVSGDESELKKIKKQKFSDIGVRKLKLNSESVAIRNEDNKVVFVNLDKKTVIKEYKKFSVNQEIDSELGLEYLNL